MEDGNPILSTGSDVNNKMVLRPLRSVEAKENGTRGKDMTNLFIDGFNPLHVRDRILRIMPVFRVATPQFINERL